MKSSQYELSLLVDNKPIQEYHHEGNVFVEGRSGKEYKLRVKNNTGTRACIIVSVDGLSVLDGKTCSNDSPGYVLQPWQQLDIECYKVDDQTGAKFIFGSKEKSYSNAVGEGTDNVGVIGAVVFREIVKPIHVHPIPYWNIPYQNPYRRFGDLYYGLGSTVCTGAEATGGMSSNSAGPLKSGSSSVRSAGVTASASSYMAGTDSGIRSMSASPSPEEESLGTGFGDAMQWKTQSVTFARETAPAARMDIFYDTRKNLERRGVKLEHKAPALPNSFPGNDGCKVPPGWTK